MYHRILPASPTAHRDREHPTNWCCEGIHFTEREAEVLALLASGQSTEDTAVNMHISPHTVTHHIGRMLDKARVRNRTELVARGFAYGILVAECWPPRPGQSRCIGWLSPAGEFARRGHLPALATEPHRPA